MANDLGPCPICLNPMTSVSTMFGLTRDTVLSRHRLGPPTSVPEDAAGTQEVVDPCGCVIRTSGIFGDFIPDQQFLDAMKTLDSGKVDRVVTEIWPQAQWADDRDYLIQAHRQDEVVTYFIRRPGTPAVEPDPTGRYDQRVLLMLDLRKRPWE